MYIHVCMHTHLLHVCIHALARKDPPLLKISETPILGEALCRADLEEAPISEILPVVTQALTQLHV